MTEDEAKTKWCPFARVGVENDPTAASYNRLQEDVDGRREPFQTLCIASRCMAFRWLPIRDGKAGGYCGLAGQP